MGSLYKILGQVRASAASGTQVLNAFPDPNFEYYSAGDQTFSHSNQGSPWTVSANSHDNHTQSYYTANDHSTGGNPTAGKSGAVRLGNHTGHQDSYWRLLPTTKTAYLSSSKTYTISGWAKAHDDNGGHYGQHGIPEIAWYNGSSWQSVNGTNHQGQNHSGPQNNAYWGTPTNSTWWNNWKQFYYTFTGGDGYFDFYGRLYQHGTGYWNYLWLDNIQVIEGAVPYNLLSQRAPDGTSGNPNALITAPFTTRSEGWDSKAYLSGTSRKLTGSWQILYTCPANDNAVISTLTLSNMYTSSATYRVAVVKAGETMSHKHMLAFDHYIAGNTTETMTLGLTISAGDTVYVQSDSDGMIFGLYGSENTP